jgi:hypothetical protein
MSSSAFGFLCDCTVIVQESNSIFSLKTRVPLLTLLLNMYE